MSTAAKTEYSGKQKAAIFLLTVGPDVASDIMKRLSEAEVDTLTYEIARLDKIRPEDKEKVLQEFQELMMAQEFISRGGIDQARAILEKALGTQKAIDIVNRLTSSLQVRPFDFVRRQDPAQLLNFIQNEHPQTIALILSYLDAPKSALIMSSLPHQIQADVTRRIAHLPRAYGGQASEWDAFPCNWCLGHFGKPHWTDDGAQGPEAARERWVGAWGAPKDQAPRARLPIVK